MNVIKVNVNFKNRTIYKQGVDLTSGDYNSTKLVFEFDRQDGRKVFEMKNPDGNLVLLTDIENNEIDLVGKNENGNNASLFDQEGKYVFEISLYDGDSKLTSAFDYIKVKQEQVIVDGEVVKPYLPIFDELMNDVNAAISETNNLDIDIQTTKDNTEVVITRKDGTEKRAIVSNGGTSNYSDLENKPKINNVELVDNKSLDDLGIQPKGNYVTDPGYVHTDNNYTDEEKSKLDSIEEGAEVNKVNSVNNQTGHVVINVPKKTSDLVNDSGFIMGYTETDPTVPSYVKNITQENIDSWNNKSNFSGSYNDLNDKPTIPTVPTNVSSFTNDEGYLTYAPDEYITETELNAKGYLTEHQDLSSYAKTTEIPTNVSELTNDSEYTTKTYVDGLVGDIEALLGGI